ncbi:hypothetical protein ACKUB1_07525 [Methanospirillum stamsii]|uniref:Uncharacterized protein n=1 Tax=Methanospirillum stamsii TaxID=1277351 RepID=A0A2V2MW58_9EURY|nr:hypothetical protein [Methanospirillum stamsii]PWR69636.1 hypothetical protein DLD82_17340 [Methanospirillum stamsii]
MNKNPDWLTGCITAISFWIKTWLKGWRRGTMTRPFPRVERCWDRSMPLLQLIYKELYDRILHVKDQSGEVRFFARVERNNLFHIVIEEMIFLKRFISKK